MDTVVLSSNTGLVPAGRIRMVPGSGVDVRRFRPEVSEGYCQRLFRFPYAGRMLRDKGLMELRGAIQTLLETSGEPCELWLCGIADAQNNAAMTNNRIFTS